jgi:hypothetical protein
LHARSDESRRSSLPYALKLAFTKEWGVVVVGCTSFAGVVFLLARLW